MTQEEEYTRPATWKDVVRVSELLTQHNVDFFLVGGYALAAHQLVRNTLDIDIAVSPTVDNSKRWIFALSHLPEEATKELIGEEDPFEGDYLHAIRINDEFTIDIMPSVAGIPFEELKKHVQFKEIQGAKIPVLDLYGLLQTKKTMRPKDQADAVVIESAIKELAASQNQSQEENFLIYIANKYIEELSKTENPRRVPPTVLRELVGATSKYSQKHGEKELDKILKKEFGPVSKKIKHAIQMEQDMSL
jgi:hypothetical protein